MKGLSIGTRLAAVVLVTGAATFGAIGVLTAMRLDRGLQEQAAALSDLSEHQLALKLDGEARLALARVKGIFAEASRQTRALAQRADVARAVDSRNDVAIRELFGPAARLAGLDILLAVAPEGHVIGANVARDLLAISEAIAGSELAEPLRKVLGDNSRVARRRHEETRRIGSRLGLPLGILEGDTLVHLVVEPTFDDFGDVSGALVSIRALAAVEWTLEEFASLSRAGVAVISERGVVSAAGAALLRIPYEPADYVRLIRTEDGGSVARCVDYVAGLKVCALTEATEVKASQEQMFRIGAEQTKSLMISFLVLAAGSLLALVGAILVSVRSATRGLPQLSRAATAVAQGDLEVPFQAVGVGEVHSLGVAFETMLTNLRSSLGRIRQLAFYDSVTGLANRERIRLDGSALLDQLAPDEAALFLFVDLKRFKAVNDAFGHKVGDTLLREVAGRLSDLFRPGADTGLADVLLARMGGDEFLAVLRRKADAVCAEACAERLLDRLSEPYEFGSARMVMGVSVGVAMSPAHGRDFDTLLTNADIALEEAKRQGRSSFCVFTPAAAAEAQERLAIENELRVAVRERAFQVHYQPKIACSNGAIVGVEALVRWIHPQRGFISPGKFIPIAEETGLLPNIGLFVLERAIDDIGPLVSRGTALSLAVNVSVLQLEDPTFADTVTAVLRRTRFPARLLELEITESMAMRESEIIQGQIARLRKAGVNIAIDDFGTGYSNLGTLARMPIDTIKLDRSLVQNVNANPEKQTIVRTILGLARSFGFKSVVEGVETHEELDFLVREGADMAQGFLFSPAVTIETLNLLLHPSSLTGLLKDEKEQPSSKAAGASRKAAQA